MPHTLHGIPVDNLQMLDACSRGRVPEKAMDGKSIDGMGPIEALFLLADQTGAWKVFILLKEGEPGSEAARELLQHRPNRTQPAAA